ncbi:hypothetical protein [Sulfuricurvum sp.]|uniref:hypothetical protein n=1 Tax=Sulfuricurvum sp. TaxID=2025608 RepID=UPI00261330C2|nr:hypothetical protein [Sulfuricurvum sp.]MDD4950884.1 hypothetical protein [Sulfuricurvum sp.]
MVNKKIVLSLLISTVSFADQTTISDSIIAQFDKFDNAIELSNDSQNVLTIYSPIRAGLMDLQGRRPEYSFSSEAQHLLERNCLANGGDIYYETKDRYGDIVSKNSFKTEVLQKMTPEEKRKYLEPDLKTKNTSDAYIITWREIQNTLLNSERFQKGYFIDTDVLHSADNYYNVTCKVPETERILFTAKSKIINGQNSPEYINVTFEEPVKKISYKRESSIKSVDELYANYIDGSKGNKLILKDDMSGRYEKMLRDYCNISGGTTITGTRKLKRTDIVMLEAKRDTACIDVDHPFTITHPSINTTVVSKDTLPDWYIGDTQSSHINSLPDPVEEFAIASSQMPIGVTSEKNIGNRKLVSTVYGFDNGGVLVNIQEPYSSVGLRNYMIINGKATNITDPNWTLGSISRLPQKMINAKQALVVQCGAYGGAQLGVDNYTATCTRQGVGSSCITNMIYTRGNQFAGKETFGCSK